MHHNSRKRGALSAQTGDNHRNTAPATNAVYGLGTPYKILHSAGDCLIIPVSRLHAHQAAEEWNQGIWDWGIIERYPCVLGDRETWKAYRTEGEEWIPMHEYGVGSDMDSPNWKIETASLDDNLYMLVDALTNQSAMLYRFYPVDSARREDALVR